MTKHRHAIGIAAPYSTRTGGEFSVPRMTANIAAQIRIAAIVIEAPDKTPSKPQIDTDAYCTTIQINATSSSAAMGSSIPIRRISRHADANTQTLIATK